MGDKGYVMKAATVVFIRSVSCVLLSLAFITNLGAKPEFVVQTDARLARPHDLTLDPSGKFLYVADTDNLVIKVFDPYTLTLLGVFGEGDLDTPSDVAFDTEGRLLVADTANDRILTYQVNAGEGHRVGEWAGEFYGPTGVFADSRGDVYVVSGSTHELLVLREGLVQQRFGVRGSAKGQFSHPHDVEVNAAGRIYVADSGNGRVQVFNRRFDLLNQIGLEGPRLSYPTYLAIDERQWLYVSDRKSNQVLVYSEEGLLRAVLGTDGATPAKPLNHPNGVEAKGGYIWVCDTDNNRIVLYRWQQD